MTYQDVKYRAITWYAFPLLGGSLFILNRDLSSTEVLINIAFLGINYLSATVIISIRAGKWINLMKAHMGLGDILLLICLAFYFPPLNFLAFYIFSLVLIAICAGIYLKLQKPQNFTVPLAGFQGGLLGCLILISSLTEISLNNVTWLNSYLQ
ncbi:hypothetical protein [Pedobacter quisquiliarum]|uniref:hypothetical protein n=1 Tax=Pedobacter quisquiliarum TaxID=1834438 RepID=UPI00166D963F|nr:hypothetical protein [Pedobacter quisquiliarum]